MLWSVDPRANVPHADWYSPVLQVMGPRRSGDVPTCYADAAKAKEALSWTAELGVKEMCADTWRWQVWLWVGGREGGGFDGKGVWSACGGEGVSCGQDLIRAGVNGNAPCSAVTQGRAW
jgi:hypothetical protein